MKKSMKKNIILSLLFFLPGIGFSTTSLSAVGDIDFAQYTGLSCQASGSSTTGKVDYQGQTIRNLSRTENLIVVCPVQNLNNTNSDTSASPRATYFVKVDTINQRNTVYRPLVCSTQVRSSNGTVTILGEIETDSSTFRGGQYILEMPELAQWAYTNIVCILPPRGSLIKYFVWDEH